jgi:hypothetical protein
MPLNGAASGWADSPQRVSERPAATLGTGRSPLAVLSRPERHGRASLGDTQLSQPVAAWPGHQGGRAGRAVDSRQLRHSFVSILSGE